MAVELVFAQGLLKFTAQEFRELSTKTKHELSLLSIRRKYTVQQWIGWRKQHEQQCAICQAIWEAWLEAMP